MLAKQQETNVGPQDSGAQEVTKPGHWLACFMSILTVMIKEDRATCPPGRGPMGVMLSHTCVPWTHAPKPETGSWPGVQTEMRAVGHGSRYSALHSPAQPPRVHPRGGAAEQMPQPQTLWHVDICSLN